MLLDRPYDVCLARKAARERVVPPQARELRHKRPWRTGWRSLKAGLARSCLRAVNRSK